VAIDDGCSKNKQMNKKHDKKKRQNAQYNALFFREMRFCHAKSPFPTFVDTFLYLFYHIIKKAG
jgi:hypothetical protein